MRRLWLLLLCAQATLTTRAITTNCLVEAYIAASSDLHNLWPALSRYNSSRGNQPFAVIPGNDPRFPDDDCDFERTSGSGAVVEPRDSVKGDIARSFLYMVWRYQLPDNDQMLLMLQWNQADPATQTEIDRHDEIEQSQGNSNPYVRMWE